MYAKRCLRHFPWTFVLLALVAAPGHAATKLSDALVAKIDHVATSALDSTGTPSASIAVVKDGQLVYAKAFGNARLDPKTAAKADMRYSIGSISKQFTAAAILMLAQQGKLSLDDKVARFFPELTRAGDITIRQLLSHTSGYSDFWPQDYVMPFLRKPVTPQHIIDTWAEKPLDFAPGTRWQYSNTNFTIAGAIVTKVSGKTPFVFLEQHVFKPLGMTSVYDANGRLLPDRDAQGYVRFALGPLHRAPKIEKGWAYGAFELAMTASDLAKWDISMLDQSLLAPASYHQMQTEVPLRNGLGSGYGLGIFVGTLDGHRMLSHDGEVSGFTSDNLVFPDDGMAVVVLTNQVAVETPNVIARGIADVLFHVHDPATEKALARARRIFTGLQHGRIDRGQFTSDANSYFDATALKDYQSSLAPLGTPTSFVQRSANGRGGMIKRRYRVSFPHTTLDVITIGKKGGKLEQYVVAPAG